MADIPTTGGAVNEYKAVVLPNGQLVNIDYASDAVKAGVASGQYKTLTKTNSLGNQITSSASPVLEQQTNQAITTGASTLANPQTTQPGGTDPFQQKILDFLGQSKAEATAQMSSDLAAATSSFQSSLANLNFKNQNLAKELESRYDKMRQVATTNAIALNPYSQSRGAQTSANYQGAITKDFNDAAATLAHQASLEEQAMASQNQTALSEIQRQTRQTLSGLDQKLLEYGMNMQKEAKQAQQYEQTRADTKSYRAQDDFQTYINTMSGSPELQGDINSYFSSGTINPGLAPFVQKGMEAGMSPNESLSILQYQSDKVRQQQATEEYRNNQLLSAADKQTKAANLASGMSQIQTKSQELIAQGIMPGTLDYAKGVANATAGSQTGLSAAEATGYATIANIGSQLIGLKDSLNAIRNDNDLKTIILNKTGASAQSIADKDLALLTARINAIAAPVARVMFGERGVLTEPDIKRVMSSLPTGASGADVRDALYKEILTNAKNGAINKLAIDSSTYRNTTGVAPYIEKFVNDVDGVLGEMKSAGNVTIPNDINAIFNKYK